MLDRRIVPHQRRILPFQLKSPEKLVLSNGLPIFIFDNERLDLIHFAIRIRAGSLFENRKFLANPTYNLLMESVPNMTSGDVEDKLDFYGAVFQSFVNFEYVTLNFIIPKSTLKNVLPFLYAMISSPVYKEDNLSLFKHMKIKELEFNSQKINWVAGQMLYHAFLHPQMTASQMLSKEHIETLSIDLLQQYHQSTFCTENASLFVSGNINPEIMALVQHLFSQISSGNQTELPGNLLVDNNCGKTIFEKRKDSLQSSLMLGRAAMAYESKDRRLFSVVSTILGGYFGSRLMQNLREKNGYTYGIQAYSSYFGDVSIFYINTEVNVDKTQDALTECRYEMERLIAEPIGDEELGMVKNYMDAALLRKLDGSVDYMRQYMLWHSSALDESEFETMKLVIQEVDAEQVQTVARRYMNPDDFVSIVVG